MGSDKKYPKQGSLSKYWHDLVVDSVHNAIKNNGGGNGDPSGSMAYFAKNIGMKSGRHRKERDKKGYF